MIVCPIENLMSQAEIYLAANSVSKSWRGWFDSWIHGVLQKLPFGSCVHPHCKHNSMKQVMWKEHWFASGSSHIYKRSATDFKDIMLPKIDVGVESELTCRDVECVAPVAYTGKAISQ